MSNRRPELKLRTAAVYASVLALAALPALADDPWELDDTDDTQATRSHLLPGQAQTRDLQGGPSVPDQDWLWIQPLARHSYEARVSGGPLWSVGGGGGFVGAQMDRVQVTTLTVLTAGVGDEFANLRGQAVRWIAGPSQPDSEYLRLTGPPSFAQPAVPYVVELHDTTYAIPRWNNSATQSTIFLIHNNRPLPVTGNIDFFGASGTLVHTVALSVPANGLQVLNTGAVPQLAGMSGAARVAHTGGRGALSGKAVAVEPGSGFTFDTAMTPVQP